VGKFYINKDINILNVSKEPMNLPTKTDYFNYFNDNRVPNAVAVTLTMKQRIESSDFRGRFGVTLDPIRVSENTRHFLNRVNQSVFGKGFLRYGKRLSVIPVTEGNAVIRLHIHMTLERPEHMNLGEFERLISECWSKTKFGYNDIQIKPIDHYEGWMGYILKNKSKSEGLQSSVDWDNVFLH